MEDSKFTKIVEASDNWNRKKISSDDFVMLFREIYQKEVNQFWVTKNEYLDILFSMDWSEDQIIYLETLAKTENPYNFHNKVLEFAKTAFTAHQTLQHQAKQVSMLNLDKIPPIAGVGTYLDNTCSCGNEYSDKIKYENRIYYINCFCIDCRLISPFNSLFVKILGKSDKDMRESE